jgi:hypothetical protein
MAVGVVVLLEVIDVEVDAPKLSLRLRLALSCDRIQIPAIVAACERIADAELEKLGLKLLSLSDVNENSVAVFLAGFWINLEKSAVGDRSHFPVAPCELELDVPDRAIALQQRHLSRPYLRPYKITGTRTLELLQRFDTEHLQKGGIRVDDLPIKRRDVDSFLQSQRQLAERLRIAQIAKTLLFFGLSRGLGTTHINASANGTSVALMEG